jgi:hypothetical protein
MKFCASSKYQSAYGVYAYLLADFLSDEKASCKLNAISYPKKLSIMTNF